MIGGLESSSKSSYSRQLPVLKHTFLCNQYKPNDPLPLRTCELVLISFSKISFNGGDTMEMNGGGYPDFKIDGEDV